jgi:predicted metalloprotease
MSSPEVFYRLEKCAYGSVETMKSDPKTTAKTKSDSNGKTSLGKRKIKLEKKEKRKIKLEKKEKRQIDF